VPHPGSIVGGVPVTRKIHLVSGLALGDATRFEDGTLTVAASDLEPLFETPVLAGVRVALASPGESVRIVKVLDAIEPRAQGHVLRGAAVVAAGYVPRAQEAVADMSGPAAELSPLGSTHNLVVEFTPAEGAPWEEVDRALRRGALALAARLAEAALDAPPDDVARFPSAALDGDRRRRNGLPRVGAVTNLQTQGTFKDVFVYGRSFGRAMPTLIEPGDVDDGAVVSGQFGHPALKNPTWVHQNHPVVAALRERDGRDLEFAGVVISPEPVEQNQKELVSAHAARVCAAAGFDAAVVTKEGGGNADADMALKMDALEELGIAGVGIFGEMAGATGTGPPIVVAPTKATAMVSTGNYDERVTLPPVERAFGGERVDVADAPATGELELPTAAVYCALSPLGWGRLTCAAMEVAE
jgi:glycine reductase